MNIGKALDEALKEAVSALTALGETRQRCNGWKHLADLFERFGRFAEDGLDEVLSYLEQARVCARELIEENETLKERLEALDVPEERTA